MSLKLLPTKSESVQPADTNASSFGRAVSLDNKTESCPCYTIPIIPSSSFLSSQFLS